MIAHRPFSFVHGRFSNVSRRKKEKSESRGDGRGSLPPFANPRRKSLPRAQPKGWGIRGKGLPHCGTPVWKVNWRHASPEGEIMTAQHGAAGGMLGKRKICSGAP